MVYGETLESELVAKQDIELQMSALRKKIVQTIEKLKLERQHESEVQQTLRHM